MKSFKEDGVQLDTSGYNPQRRRNPISRHRYYTVYREGDDKPADLVREQASGKHISIIDTMRERAHSKKAGWQESAFKPTDETDANWSELPFEEVQNILKSGLKGFGRAKRATSKRKSYGADTKRKVIEARESGSSWKAIENLYGVPAGTARRWVEGADEDS